MYVIKEAGFVIPDQISVIGFGYEPNSSYFMPSLTSVWQPLIPLPKPWPHPVTPHFKNARADQPLSPIKFGRT
ncbi:transcriptional regulator [Flammeovirgaceae bacterium 311]|nr:transcriptional regulator [Flammeovirgaceae bacterium 311]